MHRISSLVIVIATGVWLPRASCAPDLPAPTGTYKIGRASYSFATNRTSKRRVMAYLWYPADPGSVKGKAAAPYLPGFDEIVPRLSAADLADMFRPGRYAGPDSLPTTSVIEDAPMPRGNKKFPLLIFSHGWGNSTFLYTAELQDLASHGYIVAAIDHPGDSAFTRFPNADTDFFAQKAFDAAAAKPQGLNAYAKERAESMAEDNREALNQILARAKAKDPRVPFHHRIDEQHIGSFGHSIGGLVAARSCQTDPRLSACMDQDSTDNRGSPFIASPIEQTEKQPFFLFVVSSADVWSQGALNPDDAELAAQKLTRSGFNAIMRRQQENQTKQLSEIAGGSYRLMLFDLPGFIHRSFTDQTLFVTGSRDEAIHNFQVAQAYTLAFFDKYLKGSTKTLLDTGEPADTRARLEKFPRH